MFKKGCGRLAPGWRAEVPGGRRGALGIAWEKAGQPEGQGWIPVGLFLHILCMKRMQCFEHRVGD